MFERYTEKARRVIFFARYEAAQVGSPLIETEHLLLAVFRESPALIGMFLTPKQREDLTSRTRELSASKQRQAVSTAVDLPLSNESKRVLGYAAEEAERLGDRHIGTEHLLLGLLREQHSAAATLLFDSGLRLPTVRERVPQYAEHVRGGPSLQPGAYISTRRASNCMEFRDEAGNRVGISGITGFVPRAGDFINLRRDGRELTFRVLRVTFDYHPEPPGSPHAADILRSIVVTVTSADSPNPRSVPVDST